MLFLMTWLAWAAAAAPLRVRHARVWDGTGAPARADAWIAIADGRILAVGDEPAPAEGDWVELDASGLTVLPGLIDTHVHLEAVPGAEARKDSEEARIAAQERGLRAFLACGVTTVLDTGISWTALERIRGWQGEGRPGPRMLTLGPVLGPEDGYVEAFLPEHVGTDALDEATAHLNRLVEADAFGLKLTIEPGYVLPVLPMHAPAFRAEVAREAAARGLPVLIHAQHHSAHEAALDLSPHAVVHMVRDRVIRDELVARYAAQQTWLATTLNIDAAPLVAKAPSMWSEPLAQQVIPADQRASALGDGSWSAFRQHMAAVSLPSMATWMRRAGLAFTPVRRLLRRGKARSQENVRRLHAAGARLVIGSDSGAYDAIPFYFHGLSTLQEIAWVAEAGLPMADVLRAATGQAAEMLGLSGEVGTITVGAAADLVAVAGDPLQDPAALRQIRWSAQAGVVGTPQEWLMGDPGGGSAGYGE